MTIDINRPELEALIDERLRTGDFRDLEDCSCTRSVVMRSDLRRYARGWRQEAGERKRVWVLRTGQSISPTVVEDTLDAIREERDFTNLGSRVDGFLGYVRFGTGLSGGALPP